MKKIQLGETYRPVINENNNNKGNALKPTSTLSSLSSLHLFQILLVAVCHQLVRFI